MRSLIVRVFILGIAIVLMAVPFSLASSELKHVVFSICNAGHSQCLRIKSRSLSGSDWAPLFAFSHDAEVFIWRKNGKSENFVAQSGYFDWSTHRIVLTQKSDRGLLERIFSTDTADTLVEY
jgi:hypothetical protein